MMQNRKVQFVAVVAGLSLFIFSALALAQVGNGGSTRLLIAVATSGISEPSVRLDVRELDYFGPTSQFHRRVPTKYHSNAFSRGTRFGVVAAKAPSLPK